MGALTSLLVLASLLASIEENLPKTSYFKKIDVWFMSYIIFIFVIICFHICVDFWIKHEDQVQSEISMDFRHFQLRIPVEVQIQLFFVVINVTHVTTY